MEVPDVARGHGARVAPNIGEWWPDLTDQDIQALNAWRWRTHTGPGLRDTTRLSARSLGRHRFLIRPFRRREIGR